jgi:cytochrome c oxidase subunit 2
MTATTGMVLDLLGRVPIAHAGGVRSPANVFNEVFTFFLGMGTLVGVVVVTYTVYNAYKYRDGDGQGVGADIQRPELGEMPTGGGGGKKLFLSFFLSAAIVLGLIVWTYSLLLYIEDAPSSQEAQSDAIASAADPAQAASAPQVQSGNGTANQSLDPIEIKVTGYQFGWRFEYPSGYSQTDTLVIPKDRIIEFNVTSEDVFHNIGIPELRVKADAVPGQYTHAWFVSHETGVYDARCYELCGSGHSYMDADVRVIPRDEYAQWYDENAVAPGNETAASGNATASPNATNAIAGGAPA